MNVSEAIASRRSIRKFKQGVTIPREHFEKLLSAAMSAPSACNTRPWEFVVVESAKIRESIVELCKYSAPILSASAAIVVCGTPEVQNGICAGFWPQDCGAAVENILLEALELGYGTCWCGVYPDEPRSNGIRELIGVKSTPFCVIAVGVADEAPAARGFFEESKVRYI